MSLDNLAVCPWEKCGNFRSCTAFSTTSQYIHGKNASCMWFMLSLGAFSNVVLVVLVWNFHVFPMGIRLICPMTTRTIPIFFLEKTRPGLELHLVSRKNKIEIKSLWKSLPFGKMSNFSSSTEGRSPPLYRPETICRKSTEQGWTRNTEWIERDHYLFCMLFLGCIRAWPTFRVGWKLWHFFKW